MENFKQTLIRLKNKYSNALKASDEPVTLDLQNEFKERLSLVSGRNRIFLWINVVMLLVVFLGSVFLVYHFIVTDDLKKLALIFSISGVSISGMIYYMTHLWKQIVGIDLAIALANKLDPSALPAIINSLLSLNENVKLNPQNSI